MQYEAANLKENPYLSDFESKGNNINLQPEHLGKQFI